MLLRGGFQVHHQQQRRMAQQLKAVVGQGVAQAVVAPLAGQAEALTVARVDGFGQAGQHQHLAHDVGDQRHGHVLAYALVQEAAAVTF